MSKSINTLVSSCFAAAAAFQERVAVLRDALPAAALASREACADALRDPVWVYYGIDIRSTEKGGEINVAKSGRRALPTDHALSETCRTALSRLVKAVLAGTTSNEQAEAEECEIPAELLAAAAKLAKLAQAYEGSRRLASRAVAAAFAK